MEREFGVKESKIWLIGDSEPVNNADKLKFPFDLKHPTVHNIFTPILNQIQDDVFNIGKRIDWKKLYIRNAMRESADWKNKLKINYYYF